MKRFAAIIFLAGFLLAPALHASYPEFTSLIKNASPAVVNIRTIRSTKTMMDKFSEEGVPERFRRFFPGIPGNPAPRSGVGSGFIVESDGYILTNNHVVDGADKIIVALSDRREREAKIIGQDPLSDLALLKIEETDLTPVKIGRSENIQVGQWVVAIGSPFDFEFSVTAGIVSAIGRSLPGNRGNYVPFIQTDVAINPGNSGGPLLDLNGEVIGINSQIFTRSGGFMGLSFAIPIDVAMEVVAQLKDKGSVSRGWLGILIQQVDRDLAESFGLDRPAGALVTQVLADSPAEESGIREGDIIMSFNGKTIDLSSELPHQVGRTPANSRAKLEIVRNGKRMMLDVTIGKLEEDNRQNLLGRSSPANMGNRIGVEVAPLSDTEKRRLRVDEGVLVQRVWSGPARDAGIRRGDVITDFNGEAITDVRQLGRLADELAEGVTVPVRIVRNKQPQFIALKAPVGR